MFVGTWNPSAILFLLMVRPTSPFEVDYVHSSYQGTYPRQTSIMDEVHKGAAVHQCFLSSKGGCRASVTAALSLDRQLDLSAAPLDK